MPSTAEMEKLQSTLDYFKRYYEFGDAIAVYQENRRYLGTYIHSRSDVEEQFGLKNQLKKAMLLSLGAGAVCGLIAMLIAGMSSFGLKNIIAFLVTAAVVFIGANLVLKNTINKKFLIKWEEQKDVNVGLTTQVEDLERRCQQLQKQQQGYLAALEEKKLAHIPVKYIEQAEEIADFVRNDKAQTVEDAVKMYEDMLAAKKAEEEEKARKAAELKLAAAKEQEKKRQAAAQKQSSPFLKLGGAKTAEKPASKPFAQKSAAKSSSGMGLKLPQYMEKNTEKATAPATAFDEKPKQSIENEIGLELQRVLGASVSTSPASSSRSSRKPASTLSFSMFEERKQAEELAAKKAAAISEDPVFKAVMEQKPEPVVEEVAPVAEVAEPVVEEVAPVAEVVAPIVEVAEPVAEIAEPVAEIAEPVVEEVAPVAEEAVVEKKPEISFTGLSMSSFMASKTYTEKAEEKAEAEKPVEKPATSSFSGLAMSSYNAKKAQPATEEVAPVAEQKPSSSPFLRMAQK